MKKFISMFLIVLFIFNLGTFTFAAEGTNLGNSDGEIIVIDAKEREEQLDKLEKRNDNFRDLTVSDRDYNFYLQEDELLKNAKLISEEVIQKSLNTKSLTQVYELEDGTIITDTLTIVEGGVLTRSSSGTDTATRTRTISEWGEISITATLTWYDGGLFAYVKCNSMSASHDLDPRAVVDTWDTDYSNDYVALGKANAKVDYQFHNGLFPLQFQKGTFKITCTDTGTITDKWVKEWF